MKIVKKIIFEERLEYNPSHFYFPSTDRKVVLTEVGNILDDNPDCDLIDYLVDYEREDHKDSPHEFFYVGGGLWLKESELMKNPALAEVNKRYYDGKPSVFHEFTFRHVLHVYLRKGRLWSESVKQIASISDISIVSPLGKPVT